MKNKFLIIVVLLASIAIAIIYFAGKKQPEYNSDKLVMSKTMEKSVAGCKKATIEIDGTSYKLINEVARIDDVNGDSGIVELRFANRAAKGLLNSGPVNDLACIYELTSSLKGKKTYITILAGLTNNDFATQGTLLLGDNVVMKNVKIEGNNVLVEYSDLSGKAFNKTIVLDGDSVLFGSENNNDNDE